MTCEDTYFLLLIVKTVFLLCAGHVSDVHPQCMIICKPGVLSYDEFIFCCASGLLSITCFLLMSSVSDESKTGIYKSLRYVFDLDSEFGR